MVFSILIYIIPFIMVLVTIFVGFVSAKFYLTEVIRKK